MDLVPTQITLEQQVAALTAFFDALDLDPMAAYFPLVVTSDQISFPMVPAGPGDLLPGSRLLCEQAVPPAGRTNAHPQGDPHGVLSCMVTIKVVG